MTDLWPFVITGLAAGSLYGLAGLGLVLTYRTSGVFNFGHGAVAAGAAFVFYTLHVDHRVPWPLAALVTIVLFGVVVGNLLERVTRGLNDAPQAVAIVATVGILLGIEGLLFVQYGNVTRNFPEFLPTSGFTVSGVNVSWAQVISTTLATCAAAGLYAFLRLSRLGVTMRAVVDNPTLVGLAGERPVRVMRVSWMIGSAFAALSGILLAPTLGLDANLLTLLVVQAFGACAVGLFSSLPLTYAGGFLVGVIAAVATKYAVRPPFTGLPSSVPFLVLIVVLLAVPVSKLPSRPDAIRGFVPSVRTTSALTRRALAATGVIALIAVPALVGTKLPIWTNALVYSVILGSLALLVWISGQISLCHAAFVALGATTFSHLTSWGVPWAVALVGAGLCVVPIGALVAVPAIRLSGIYLALATLGFGIVMQNVVYSTSWMFGSGLTVTAPRPKFGFVDGASDTWLYYVVLTVAAATAVVLATIQRGRLGRLLRGLSERPTMLATHGLGINVTRLIVFCVSAFFAGIGGALAITLTGAASGVGYGPIQSLLLLAILAVCGTRLLRSSVLAAALYAIVPGYVSAFDVDRQLLGFGVLAVAAAALAARRTQLAAWFSHAAATSDARLRHGPAARPARVPRPNDDAATRAKVAPT